VTIGVGPKILPLALVAITTDVNGVVSENVKGWERELPNMLGPIEKLSDSGPPLLPVAVTITFPPVKAGPCEAPSVKVRSVNCSPAGALTVRLLSEPLEGETVPLNDVVILKFCVEDRVTVLPMTVPIPVMLLVTGVRLIGTAVGSVPVASVAA